MKTVEQMRELPVEERLQLIGELWDSIEEDSSALKLSPAQKAEPNRRRDEVREGKVETIPKEEAQVRRAISDCRDSGEH